MLQNINISSSRDGFAQIGGQKLAAPRQSLRFETGSCLLNGLLAVHQHTLEMRKSFKNRIDQCASAAPKVSNAVVPGEVPRKRDWHIILRRCCTHNGAEYCRRLRVL